MKKLSVLLVEDSVVNQMIISRVLTNEGHRCDVVQDGHEVIEALALKHYDIILMDCQLPRLDGYVTTQMLRRSILPTVANALIVGFSANESEENVGECLKSGMNGFLPKSTHIRALCLTIIQHVERHENKEGKAA